jgi:Mycothiol maleylpyruvate isomerase N-terminal domain
MTPAARVGSNRHTDEVTPEDYEAVHARVAALVLEGDPETPVPACPEWRVRDVIAHLVGLCEDWVDHRLDGYGSKRCGGSPTGPGNIS